MTPTPSDSACLRAGVGKVEITLRQQGAWKDLLAEKVQKHIPPEYLCKNIEVSDPLYVRALVLDDGGEQVVLVTMDVTAIAARTISQNILSDSADDFMPRLRERVEQELDIPGRSVCVCASHTHQVPRMLCDDDAQIDRTLEAIRQARQGMVPVALGFGRGREDRLTFNRTLMMKDGSDFTVRSCVPLPPDDQIAALRPVDPQIGILRIDRLDGRPLAVVYNFAAHLLLGSPEGKIGTITADHAGVTLQYLEDHIGGGIMAFFLQGALGDVSEADNCDIEQPRSAREFGTKLGQSVWQAYRQTPVTTDPARLRLQVATRRIDLPLRTDIPPLVAALKREQAELLACLRYTFLNFKAFLPLYLKHTLGGDHPGHWAYRYRQADACGDATWRMMDERNRVAVEKYLDSLRRMERLAENEEKIATLEKQQEVIDELAAAAVPAEFQGIRIGDGLLITAPMEVLSETGLQVKRMSPVEHTCVVSLANGYLHYAPPASYYPRGGYEVTECLLAPQWQALFERTVQELFDELHTDSAASLRPGSSARAGSGNG